MSEAKFEDLEWVFFDWGGTLKDEIAIYEAIASQSADYLEAQGCAVDPRALFDRLVELERANSRVMLEQALLEQGVPGEQIDGARQLFEVGFPQPWYEGAEEIVKILSQEYQLGVISNNNVSGFEEYVAGQGLSQLFDVIVGSTDAGVRKPAAAIFLLALEQAKCPADRAVMVGDRLDKDIAGANGVGMQTVRIRQGIYADEEPTNPDERPDAEIADIRDLPALLGVADR